MSDWQWERGIISEVMNIKRELLSGTKTREAQKHKGRGVVMERRITTVQMQSGKI